MNKGTTLRLILAISLFQAGIVLAQYSGGDGTENNPWRISSKTDLLALGDNVEDYNDCFVMTSDINMVGDIYFTALIAADNNEGYGFQGFKFGGVFDGNGFKIKGLMIDDNSAGNSFLGLFGSIDTSEIKNLGLEDCFISSSQYAIGSLVAKSHQGNIINCYSTGVVSGSYDVGGLVGINDNGKISDCYSKCTVSSSLLYSTVGGLVGRNNKSDVTRCFSTGDVCGGSCVGGLAGWNSGSIFKCYSTGMISGSFALGGLVGFNNSNNISNCYSKGAVSGSFDVGGLVGQNLEGNISNCYSIGKVFSSSNAGGLVGLIIFNGNVSNCFWDIQKNETMTAYWWDNGNHNSFPVYSTEGIAEGKTSPEMKMLSTFVSADWDFVNIWSIGENQTYPYLRQSSASDINQDKKIDYFDLAEMANNWLSGVE